MGWRVAVAGLLAGAGVAAGVAAAAPLDTTALLQHWRLPPMAEMPAGRLRTITTLEGLRQALADAQPGDVLWLRAGDYPVARYLVSARDGRPDAPITLRGEPGARLRVLGTMALKLRHAHWVVEGLQIEGQCAQVAQCEHALQVVGGARHLDVRHNRLLDFNAALKINGERGQWPDFGRVHANWIENRAPRPSAAPTVAIDLVGASGWELSDNLVAGYVKAGGDRISYALFMKGGGEDGRVLRNLVVCAPQPGFVPSGQQVGISFGGGLTSAAAMRPSPGGHEHRAGLAQDNTVLNCNDTSLDVNHAADTVLRGNRFLGGGGVTVRGPGASALAERNLGSAPLRARHGAQLQVRAQRDWQPATEDARAALAALPPTSP
jgi:hypothetical protein